MKKSVEQVKEFHLAFEHPIGKLEGLEPLKIRQLRIKLLFEEIKELAEASDVQKTFKSLCEKETDDITIHHDGDNVNKVEELDALCDIQYVLDGKKLTSGLYEVFEEGFNIVHSNNMTKAHRDEEHVKESSEKLGIHLECINRNGVYIAVNPDGKLTKPWDHKKVSLNHLIPV